MTRTAAVISKRSPSSPFHPQSGYSLVELSVVLVVLGMMVGALSIGSGVHRTSEYQRIKKTFVDQWASAYNDFYVRAGRVPGDSAETPTFVVNAAADEDVLELLLAVEDGDYSDFVDNDESLPPRLCEGSANDTTPGARPSDTTSMRELFAALGVQLPSGRAEGQEDRYVYLDTNGNPQELQVCFQWNPPETLSGGGNVMVLKGLTPDLARMLDATIDGRINAVAGAFREQRGADAGDSPEWTYDVRDSVDESVGRNESQVRAVTAHYRMSQ